MREECLQLNTWLLPTIKHGKNWTCHSSYILPSMAAPAAIHSCTIWCLLLNSITGMIIKMHHVLTIWPLCCHTLLQVPMTCNFFFGSYFYHHSQHCCLMPSFLEPGPVSSYYVMLLFNLYVAPWQWLRYYPKKVCQSWLWVVISHGHI